VKADFSPPFLQQGISFKTKLLTAEIAKKSREGRSGKRRGQFLRVLYGVFAPLPVQGFTLFNGNYFSGESLMRNRVRTCSESNSIAERFAMGSAWAKYFMASTSVRCPST
jgi:hypothetical protein